MSLLFSSGFCPTSPSTTSTPSLEAPPSCLAQSGLHPHLSALPWSQLLLPQVPRTKGVGLDQGYRSGSRQGWGGYPPNPSGMWAGPAPGSGRGRQPPQAGPNCIPRHTLPRCSPQASWRSNNTSDSHTGPLTAPGRLTNPPSCWTLTRSTFFTVHQHPNPQHPTHTPKPAPTHTLVPPQPQSTE